MDVIFYTAGGAIIGLIVDRILTKHKKTHGVIDIDHNTEMCRVRITSEELSNRKVKKAVFTINHDAIISREEQSL